MNGEWVRIRKEQSLYVSNSTISDIALQADTADDRIGTS